MLKEQRGCEHENCKPANLQVVMGTGFLVAPYIGSVQCGRNEINELRPLHGFVRGG